MIKKCTASVNVIRNLADEPSLSAQELKYEFDKAAQNIKDWLNDEFIPDLETQFGLKQDLINIEPDSTLTVNENGDIVSTSVSVNEISYLAGVTSNVQEQIDKLSQNLQSKITYGTESPDGGSNGDIYIQYAEYEGVWQQTAQR